MKKAQFKCDCTVIHEDVVDRVSAVFPEDADLHALANIYRMFSDNTRIKIMWALNCESMCVCDLAVLLDMTKSAISHQLKTLRLAGLVKNARQGREVFYSIEDNEVENVRIIFARM